MITQPISSVVGAEPVTTTRLGGTTIVSSPTSVYVIDRDIEAGSISTTDAETTLYTCTYPVEKLISRALRLRLWGQYVNGKGDATIRIKVKIDATTIYDSTLSTTDLSNGDSLWSMDWTSHFENLTTQRGVGRFSMTDSTPPTTGKGSLGVVLYEDAVIGSITSATLTVTNSFTFTVTVQHSSSDANLAIKKYGALLEIV